MDFVELDGAVDLHVHSYPCVFQRRIDDRQAAQAAADKGMAAIVLKSHHESTVSRAYLLQSEFPDLKIYGGVVLNQWVGGINPAAAEVALRLGAKEVWMPTIDAAHHVDVHGKRGGYDVQDSSTEFVWGEPISAVKDGKGDPRDTCGVGADRSARRDPGDCPFVVGGDLATYPSGPRARREKDPHHAPVLQGSGRHER